MGFRVLRNAGYSLHGMMHVGQGLVCGGKIQDLISAGFQFTIFLADYHSMINNKYGGDLQKIRTTGEYFQHCFTAIGVPKEKVEYVWASDLADRKEYWERVLRVARTVSTQRVLRAIPIMGRDMKSKDTDAAAIFYPCMQAADIFEMKLDVACAGIDQRKAHILAREAGERLGWDRKIQRAFCPAGVVEGNPILEYYRILVFRDSASFELERDPKYGGSMEFETYPQLEKAFATGKIHPKDLKTNISRILSEKLAPVRDYFKKHPALLEEMHKLGGG